MKFDQKPSGARFGKSPLSAEIDYVFTGIFDRATAKAIATSLLPNAQMLTEGMVYLKDVQLTERGHAIHDVTAVYGQGDTTKNGSVRFGFSISGKTIHVQGTNPDKVRRYSKPGTPAATNFYGLINVNNEAGQLSVLGGEITVATSQRRVAVKFASGIVTEAYAATLENLVGCCNSVRFLGREPGEIVFLGAEGEQGTDVETTITFTFGIERNLVDQKYGEITGVRKDGQELLWIYHGNADDAGKPSRKPTGVYVHEIGERVNFAALLGFGA